MVSDEHTGTRRKDQSAYARHHCLSSARKRHFAIRKRRRKRGSFGRGVVAQGFFLPGHTSNQTAPPLHFTRGTIQVFPFYIALRP